MPRFACLLILLVLVSPVHAQDASPLVPPTMPTFEVAALDTTVNVCENAYQYACGGWHAKHPMPDDVSFWSRPFTQFLHQVEDYMRGLVERAAQPDIDRTRFDEGAQCIADQFTALEYAPGIPMDGAYVVSEQVAELSAWSIAWEAYEQATAGQPQPEAVGFTPKQRYFLTNAQVWCTDATEGRW